MKLVAILSFWLISFGTLSAQNNDSDFKKSIVLIEEDAQQSYAYFYKALDQATSVYNKLSLHYDYALALNRKSKNTESLKIANEGLLLPKTDSNYLLHASIYKIKIDVFNKKTEFDSSKLAINKLEQLAEKYQDNGLFSTAYYRKGALLEDNGDLTRALEAYLESMQYAEKSENPLDLASAQLHIAIFYEGIDKYDLCIDYNKKALRTFMNAENAMSSVTMVYNNIGLVYDQLKDYDSANFFLEKAYHLADSLDLKYGRYIVKQNLGLIAYRTKQYDKAIGILKEVYTFFKEQSDDYGVSLACLNLGRAYRDSDRPDEGLKYMLEGYERATKNGLINEIKEVANDLVEVYVSKGNYERAFYYQNQEVIAKDSIYSKDKNYEIGRLESKNELDKRDFQNQLNEQEIKLKDTQIAQQATQRNLLLIGILLLAFILALIFRSQRIKTKSNEALEIKNKQIKELEELKTRWFINVSHELQTPLTLVQGPVTKILKSNGLSAPHRSDLEMANRNLKQLNGLVAEILDFSKLEVGHLTLDRSTINLSEVLRTIVASFESLAYTNEVSLKVHIEKEYWIEADIQKIRQLVQNLVSNALKFTHANGSVEVSVAQSPQADLQVMVTDTGEGISEEDIPYIFDRFFQSKNKKKSRQGGAGIGLSLAREVAEMHGGTLTVTSSSSGSCFKLTIPKELLREAPKYSLDTPEKDKEANHPGPYKSRIHDKPKLLLVEDNPDMRTYIESILKDDYNIILARDGKDALQKLSNNDIDMIISDVMMPRMDGIELIKEVKKKNKWSQLPFIILTALNSEEDRIHTLQTGIDDYLHKPFHAEELKVRAKNLLKNRQQRIEEQDEVVESYDDKLLRTLETEIKTNLTESFLSVTYLAEQVAMSESSLRRYLKRTTGLTPLEFILELKLQRALALLEQRAYATVKEVAAKVGFDRPSRFSSSFEKRFGKKPADYL